jgi:hypothetical protein
MAMTTSAVTVLRTTTAVATSTPWFERDARRPHGWAPIISAISSSVAKALPLTPCRVRSCAESAPPLHHCGSQCVQHSHRLFPADQPSVTLRP